MYKLIILKKKIIIKVDFEAPQCGLQTIRGLIAKGHAVLLVMQWSHFNVRSNMFY